MADAPPQSVGTELLEVNFSQLVGGMGQGIADAQLRLDMVSMQLAQMMSGRDYKLLVMDENGYFKLDENHRPVTIDMPAVKVAFGGGEYSLLELGFTPTFYQFVDTIIEVKVSVSITREETASRSAVDIDSRLSLGGTLFTGFNAGLKVSTVSASFASKYQYSAEGSSLLRTKLVPVPPPAILQERMRRLAESEPIG
jgi:hypothetical protein